MTPSPYLNKSELDNIQNDIKAYTEKHHSEIKAMNEYIAAMIVKLNGKSDKKIEKQIHPMSVQITGLLSKQSENFNKKCLLSPLNIHIMNITLRENIKPRSIHLIKFSNNQKNN